MVNAFYGIKLGQTQTFTEDGIRIPVTEILAAPLTVIQIKSADRDGYVALKVGLGERKGKNIKKPTLGEFNKITKPSNVETQHAASNDDKKVAVDVKEETTKKVPAMYPRYLREIRVKDNVAIKDIKVGDKLNIADIFKPGDTIHVSGITIGKGFAGVVKRHGFAGGPRTHGQSDRERSPGSIGQTTTPGRVYKNKRMAGRMGGEQATVKNLKVVKIDAARNIVLIKGLIPGKRRGVVRLYK